MKSRARQLVDKSIAAILSAIEIYNKPNFAYREETYSILTINAWELLLKGRILQLDRNKMSAIIEYGKRTLSDGTSSQKSYRKKNRSGNEISIGLFKAYDKLINEYGDSINPIIRKNLEALTEIRDNAIHYLNNDFGLRKKIHEIGTANLKNYLNLTRQWFGTDLNEFHLFLMPIGFLNDISSIKAITPNFQERKLLDYIKLIEKSGKDPVSNEFNFSLDIDIKMKRVSNSPTAQEVVISNSPSALPIKYSEEDFREKYPWDYKILNTRLRKRYTNFKMTKKYHQIKKKLEENSKYCKKRYLDPSNLKGTVKKFYSPNIMKKFDKHYKKVKVKG